MNKNIVSLNNHAYKLFGYDVNIVPIKEIGYISMGELYESSYNDVSMTISQRKDQDNYCADKRILRIDSHTRRNLYSFNRHYHAVFNNDLITSELIVHYKPPINNRSYLVINSYKIKGSSRYTNFEMLIINGTNEVINNIIKTCLGKSIEQDTYYIIE